MKFLSAKYEISQLRASIQASAGDADDALSRTRDECGEATQAMPAVRTSARGAAPIAAACDFWFGDLRRKRNERRLGRIDHPLRA